MPRTALLVSYEGTEFVGWQAPRNGRGVQDVLGAAVADVADEPVERPFHGT